MNNERLQDYQDMFDSASDAGSFALMYKCAKATITALEAAQADATKEKERGDEYDNQLVELHDILTATQTRCLTMENANKDLRAQLAEAQAEVVKLKKHIEVGQDIVLGLRAELAEAEEALLRGRQVR